MLIIGLTGGIGSGKSEVSRRFEKLGVPVIDTDLIARDLVTPGSEALAEIAAAFGEDLILADGTLDRRLLRERVFKETTKRERLEDILHPKIRDGVAQALAGLSAPYAIVVIPLLLETRYPIKVDRILVVDAAPEIQLHRVQQRDSVSNESARRILEHQAGRAERLAAADDIIDNSGDLRALDRAVRRLHDDYLGLMGPDD